MDVKFECKETNVSVLKHNLIHLPPVHSRVMLGAYDYEVMRHEFDYENEEIRIFLIPADELGINKTVK